MLKKSMSLNKLVAEIKKVIPEGTDDLFIEYLSDEEKAAVREWAENKTESYLINQLRKHDDDASVGYYEENYKDINYNIAIDLIDYSL